MFACTADSSAALTVSAPGVPTRTFTGPASQPRDVWGLHPNTRYDWEWGDASGTFTTGSLPDALDALHVDVQGALFGMDAVLVYVGCGGYFVILDEMGQPLWFTQTEAYNRLSDGMSWSQATRSVLALADSTMVVGSTSLAEAIHISGTRATWVEGEFQLRLTHDIARWGLYTYLLGEDEAGVGGFEVFEGRERLGHYLMREDFAGVPGLENGHVNGLTVTETGEVVISVLNFDAVIAVDGDPASPTFLQLAWHAAGDPGGPDDLPDPDYVPATPPAFAGQHNASRHGDALWVFDNTSVGDARALRLRMDAATGQLTETGAWSMAQRCVNQGGAIPVPGGVLATCANTRDVYLFAEDEDEPSWRLNAGCSQAVNPLPGVPGGAIGSTRAFPVVIE